MTNSEIASKFQMCWLMGPTFQPDKEGEFTPALASDQYQAWRRQVTLEMLKHLMDDGAQFLSGKPRAKGRITAQEGVQNDDRHQ